MKENLGEITAWLFGNSRGYKKLMTSDDLDHYFLARVKNAAEVADRIRRLLPFNIEFDCKPLKYDILGENAVIFTGEGNLYNKYFEPSRPIITVYGSGQGNVYIGNQNIAISNVDEYVTIDAEMQDAFKGLQNKNATVNTADIVLLPGNNAISFSGGVTSVEIKPRWVTI